MILVTKYVLHRSCGACVAAALDIAPMVATLIDIFYAIPDIQSLVRAFGVVLVLLLALHCFVSLWVGCSL